MERGHAGHENRNGGGNEGDGARDQRHQKYVEKHDAEGKNGDSSHALVSNRMEQSGKAVVFHGVVPFCMWVFIGFKLGVSGVFESDKQIGFVGTGVLDSPRIT